jgi:hypothetical protein
MNWLSALREHICSILRGFTLPATNSRGNTSTSGMLVFPQKYQTMEQLCLPENNSNYQGTDLFDTYNNIDVPVK